MPEHQTDTHQQRCHCGEPAAPSHDRCELCLAERGTMCLCCATQQMMHRMHDRVGLAQYPLPTHCAPVDHTARRRPTLAALHAAAADGDRVAERRLDAYFDACPS